MIYAYLGTYTDDRDEGIFVYQYDAAAGHLERTQAVPSLANPTFLAIHPSKRFLYAVSEVDNHAGQKQSAASAYAINPATGQLSLINHVSSPGLGACHIALSPDARHVVIANYGNGSVAVLPVNGDGSLGEATDYVEHHGHGPHPNQDSAHAHCTTFSPDGKIAYVNDLGIDKVMAYRLEGGKLVPHKIPFLSVASGAGPRHVAFHPNGREGYIINELDNTIDVVDYDAKTGELRPKQTISTLPDDYNQVSYCADVHVHPNGKFVYGSNRGHNSIALFMIGATGLLMPAGHFSTRGNWPRNFAIDPGGQRLWVANHRSDDVFAFNIDPHSGELTPTGQSITLSRPVCVKFVTL
jgi:6-phosphogluconolactonase